MSEVHVHPSFSRNVVKMGRQFIVTINSETLLWCRIIRSCPVLQLSTTPWRRIGGMGYSSNNSLTSALDGGEWLASRPRRFNRRERALGTHWIGGWVGPRAVLNTVVKMNREIIRDLISDVKPFEIKFY